MGPVPRVTGTPHAVRFSWRTDLRVVETAMGPRRLLLETDPQVQTCPPLPQQSPSWELEETMGSARAVPARQRVLPTGAGSS